MSKPNEKLIDVNGSRVRVWEKGQGSPLALMLGFGGSPYWPEFAEILAEERHVHLVSLPGQQGSDRGHDLLHGPLDWIVAVLDILEQALPYGTPVDLVSCSAAGILGAEVAAIAPQMLRSLTLIGPLGLYNPADPPVNPYAQATFNRPKLLMADQARYGQAFGPPQGLSELEKTEFDIVNYRSDEAIARLIWPFGDIKGHRRLRRIRTTPVLLLWGEADKLVPPSYAKRYAELIPAPVVSMTIPDAGHLATFDAPEATARLVLEFLRMRDRPQT